MSQATLTVPDMSCAHCQQRVTDALTPVTGVEAVDINLDAKTVTVNFDDAKTNVNALSAVLAAEDYPVAAVS